MAKLRDCERCGRRFRALDRKHKLSNFAANGITPLYRCDPCRREDVAEMEAVLATRYRNVTRAEWFALGGVADSAECWKA